MARKSFWASPKSVTEWQGPVSKSKQHGDGQGSLPGQRSQGTSLRYESHRVSLQHRLLPERSGEEKASWETLVSVLKDSPSGRILGVSAPTGPQPSFYQELGLLYRTTATLSLHTFPKLGLQHHFTYGNRDAIFQPDITRALRRRQNTIDSRNHPWRCQSWSLTLLKLPHTEMHNKAARSYCF